jgi:hypothetical protein
VTDRKEKVKPQAKVTPGSLAPPVEPPAGQMGVQYFERGELTNVHIHTSDGQVLMVTAPNLLIGESLISAWGSTHIEGVHVKRSSVNELRLFFNSTT